MLSEGFEPPTTASKAAVISISPRERWCENITKIEKKQFFWYALEHGKHDDDPGRSPRSD